MSDVILTVGGNTTPLDKALANSLGKKRSLGDLDVKNVERPLGKITGKASEFTKSLEAANARVIAFGASAGAIAALKISFDKLVESTITVEKSLVDINTLLNVSSRDLKKFGAELFSISNQTSVAFRDAAAAATEFSRQGLGATETINRTKAALVLAKLSGTDFTNSVNSLTAAINSFKNESLEAIDVVNRLAAVDARFAVSADDLSEGIKRVGSSASDANVTLNQTIALITAAQQTTARGGAVIGNSFKTIFTRLQRPVVLKQLEDIGIQTKKATGETRPLVDILTDLANRYDSLAPSQRSYTAEIVGSVFQINVLKAVLGDLGQGFSIYKGALKAAAESSGEAERRIEKLNQTISGKLTQTLNKFQQVGAAIGNFGIGDAIGQGLDFGGFIADSFSAQLTGEGLGGELARGILKSINNIISGPGIQLLTVTMFKLFQKLTSFGSLAVKEFFELNKSSQDLAIIQKEVFNHLRKNPELIAKMRDGSLTLSHIQDDIKDTLSEQNVILREQERLSKLIARNLKGGGISVSPAPAVTRQAAGYIPNFNALAREEQEARSLGASASVRAHGSKGTIGGKKFVMNNQEVEIPRFGSNGDSAVIPMYAAGNMGLFGFSGGFFPNFSQMDFFDKLSGTKKEDKLSKMIRRLVKKNRLAPEELAKLRTSSRGTRVSRESSSSLDITQEGVLHVGYLKSDTGNPFPEILKLLTSGALTGVDGGMIIGPKIPSLLERVHKVVPTLRDEGVVSGKFPLTGYFTPASLVDSGKAYLIDKENAVKESYHSSRMRQLYEELHGGAKNRMEPFTSISDMKEQLTEAFYSSANKKKLASEYKALRRQARGMSYYPVGLFDQTTNDRVPNFKGFLKKQFGDTIGSPVARSMTTADNAQLKESLGYIHKQALKLSPEERRLARIPDNFDDFYGQLQQVELDKIFPQGLARGFMPNFANPFTEAAQKGNVEEFKRLLAFELSKGGKGPSFSRLKSQDQKFKALATSNPAAHQAISEIIQEYEDRDKPKPLTAVQKYKEGLAKEASESGMAQKLADLQEVIFQTGGGNLKYLFNQYPRAKGENLRASNFLDEFVHPSDDIGIANKTAETVMWKLSLAKLKALVDSGLSPNPLNPFTEISPGMFHITPNNFMDGQSKRIGDLYEDYVRDKFNLRTNKGAGMKYKDSAAIDGYNRAAFWEMKAGDGYNRKQERDKYPRAVLENKQLLAGIGGYGGFGPGGFTVSERDQIRLNVVLAKNPTPARPKDDFEPPFARGFIPNFNAMGAAIARERAAGLPMSSIRMGTDSSLRSSFNPMGIGIFNSLQESSLKDGINKAKQAGINPKTKGMAAGYIPNFASGDLAISSTLGMLQFMVPQLMEMTAGGSALERQLKKATKEIMALERAMEDLGDSASDKAKIDKIQLEIDNKKKIAGEISEKVESQRIKKGKIAKTGFVASTLFEGVGGFADAFGPEVSKTKDQMVGFANSLARGGQAMAAFPGPIGIAVGVATAFASIVGTLNKTAVSLDDAYKINLRETIDNNNKQIAAIAAYNSAVDAFTNTVRNAADSGLSAELAQSQLAEIIAKRNVAEAEITSLNVDLAAKLKTASTDTERKVLSSQARDQLARENRSAEAVLSLEKAMQESTGFFGRFGQTTGLDEISNFIGFSNISTSEKEAERQIEQVVDTLKTFLSDSELDQVGRVREDGGIPKSFQDVIQENEKAAKYLEFLKNSAFKNSEAFNVLTGEMAEFTSEVIKGRAATEAAIEAEKERMRQLDPALLKGILERSFVEIPDIIKRAVEVQGIFDDLGARVRAGKDKSNQFGFAKQIAETFNAQSAADRANELSQRQELVNGFENSFNKLIKSALDDTTKEGKNNLLSLKTEQGVNDFKKFSKTVIEAAQGRPEEFLEKISKKQEELTKNLGDDGQRQIAFLDRIKTVVGENLPKLISETQEQTRELTRRQRQEQILRQIRSDLQVLGGAGGIFDAENFFKNRGNLIGGLAQAGRGGRFAGQGAIDAFEALKNIVGDRNISQGTRQSFLEKALPSTIAMLESNIGQLANAVNDPNIARDLRGVASRASEIARTQLEAQFGILGARGQAAISQGQRNPLMTELNVFFSSWRSSLQQLRLEGLKVDDANLVDALNNLANKISDENRPNAAMGMSPELREKSLARAGGYTAGSVRTGMFNGQKVTYNSAETIMDFGGSKAIAPPRNSKAGKMFASNFEAINGFNPYAAQGFVPNFAARFQLMFDNQLFTTIKGLREAGGLDVVKNYFTKKLNLKLPVSNTQLPKLINQAAQARELPHFTSEAVEAARRASLAANARQSFINHSTRANYLRGNARQSYWNIVDQNVIDAERQRIISQRMQSQQYTRFTTYKPENMRGPRYGGGGGGGGVGGAGGSSVLSKIGTGIRYGGNFLGTAASFLGGVQTGLRINEGDFLGAANAAMVTALGILSFVNPIAIPAVIAGGMMDRGYQAAFRAQKVERETLLRGHTMLKQALKKDYLPLEKQFLIANETGVLPAGYDSRAQLKKDLVVLHDIHKYIAENALPPVPGGDASEKENPLLSSALLPSGFTGGRKFNVSDGIIASSLRGNYGVKLRKNLGFSRDFISNLMLPAIEKSAGTDDMNKFLLKNIAHNSDFMASIGISKGGTIKGIGLDFLRYASENGGNPTSISSAVSQIVYKRKRLLKAYGPEILNVLEDDFQSSFLNFYATGKIDDGDREKIKAAALKMKNEAKAKRVAEFWARNPAPDAEAAPNAAGGLFAAMGREAAAGIPNSAIRVGSDPSLVTGGNPMGLGVYNTLQESSLQDGISMARRGGSNPKTNGMIPNFAAGNVGLHQEMISAMSDISGGSSLNDVVGAVNEVRNGFVQLSEALNNFRLDGNINVSVNASVDNGGEIGEMINKKIKDAVNTAISEKMGTPRPPKVKA